MGNWFAGFQQAASGMNAARYGISVVGQNIANANSPGYTRQVVTQESTGVRNVVGLYTRAAEDGIGGVEITGTIRQVDTLLDGRVRDEHAKAEYASTTADQLSGIEALFPAGSDAGLPAQLNAFWSDWSTVGANPGNTAARQVLLEHARSLAGTLNNLSSSLTDLNASMSNYLGQDVAAANTAATQLAALNSQIGAASGTGIDVNALADQRDLLVDKLAKLTGAVAVIQNNGMATVTLGSASLVSGSSVSAITADTAGNVQVGAAAVTLTGGSAAARITALQVTVPAYRAKLDGVADALSTAVNAIQTAGYDRSGSAGQPMFVGSGAGGITVALTDGALVAASGSPGGNLDGSNAQAASRLGATASGPDTAYATLVGSLGAESAAAQNSAATQESLAANLDAMKSSVSGVSYDEEIAHMLTYQRAFEASSRALTTLDAMLDTLINHTGRAGMA
jgi:flagellar hook-associated protein 1 FlgK